MARMYALSGIESKEKFAESIGYSYQWVYKMIDAAQEMEKGNDRVAEASTMQKACQCHPAPKRTGNQQRPCGHY